MEAVKVRFGKFVEKPVCIICKTPLKHSEINGDYSLLLCNKEECADAHNKDLSIGLRRNFKPHISNHQQHNNGRNNYR